MSEEIATISKQQKITMDLMGEMKELKRQNLDKDKKMTILVRRIDDLKRYSRINDLIISGLEMKPGTYARALATHAEPTESDNESIEQQVISYSDKKGIQINIADTEACHPLSR